MKTTVDISDQLLKKAKNLAKVRKTTLKKIIEEGLERSLGLGKRASKFKLKDCSFGGEGLSEEYKDYRWEDVRSAIYEGTK